KRGRMPSISCGLARRQPNSLRWDSSVGGRTPQRSSGGEMVATLDSREYGGLHQIPCPEYMLVVEPQYPVVSDTQARIPDTVRHRIVVRTAVDFDHQPL